jgi:hypothetical protein
VHATSDGKGFARQLAKPAEGTIGNLFQVPIPALLSTIGIVDLSSGAELGMGSADDQQTA